MARTIVDPTKDVKVWLSDPVGAAARKGRVPLQTRSAPPGSPERYSSQPLLSEADGRKHGTRRALSGTDQGGP
jgi:hypothetical protein